jgi:Fe2+ transport system protein B
MIISPNPQANFFSLKNVKNRIIKIIDLQGVVVLQTLSENEEIQINLSTLDEACYTILVCHDLIVMERKMFICR